MYVLNITNDYDNITFTNCTEIENEDNNIIFKYLLLSKPGTILIFFSNKFNDVYTD